MGASDQSRRLSDSGIEKAKDLAEKLIPYPPDLVAISPAVRTQETFQCINETLHIPSDKTVSEPDLYFGTVQDYLSCMEVLSMGSINRIWVIGHNPMVSYVAQSLYAEFVQGFSPATALVLETKEDPANFKKSNWTLVELIK